MSFNKEQKKIAWEYFAKPLAERPTIQEFAREHHMTRITVYKLQERWAVEQEDKIKEAHHLLLEVEEKEKKKREFSNTLGDEVSFNEEDPTAWWRKKTLEINESIVASAKRGNAQSQKLAKQLAGELVEKSEVKVGFDINQAIRTNLEADRKLREMGYRVADVPEKPALLPEKLCQDSGQGSSTDN